MADSRLILPATSVTVAALLGMGIVVLTIALSHPLPGFGLAAAVGVVVGCLLFAGGLAATQQETPIRFAVAGMASYLGLALVLGAAGLAVHQAPLITVLAAGSAILGAIFLSFVIVGYTDQSSLQVHDDLLFRWSVILFSIGILTVSVTATADFVFSQGGGSPLSGYLQAVTNNPSSAMLVFGGHLIIIFMLFVILVSQLQTLDLLAGIRTNRLLWWVLGLVSVTGCVLLLVVLVANSRSTIEAIARQSPELASVFLIAGAVIQVPALHLFILTVEAMLIVALCLCIVLRGVRAISYEQSAYFAGYLIVPLAVIGTFTIGFGIAIGYAHEVLGSELLATLNNSPLGHLLGIEGNPRLWILPEGTEAIFSVPTGYWIGRAALLGFGLFAALLLLLFSIRVVLGAFYRFESCGLPAAASAGLFTGAAFLGVTGTWPPIVAGCLVGAILTWDVLENGIGLGEQLDGRFNAVHNEFSHLFASGAVGGLAIVVGLGTYKTSRSLTAGEAPSILVVGLLLAAGVVFALLLRRS